jgi:hypothetical protein
LKDVGQRLLDQTCINRTGRHAEDDVGRIGYRCGLLNSGIELSEDNHYLGANFFPSPRFAPRGVTHESIDAIDAVREIGNIGAHMGKDVDLIVEIDDNEAQVLIDLIETLFEDWYVEREMRRRRFAGPLAIAEAKRTEKQRLLDEQTAKVSPPPDEA